MMGDRPLEPAVAAGIDLRQRACEIQRQREALQHGGGVGVCSLTRTRSVIRSVIKQDWAVMLRQGVKPRGVVPQYMDPRELESRQDDPDLALAWRALVSELRVVPDCEVMATLSDAQGCILWTGGNSKIRDEAGSYGFGCGAQWTEMGTNGIRLVTQWPLRAVQIYGPEHWMDCELRWACTAVRVMDPHTRRLLAVINVTGPWTKVHSDTLGWLNLIARRIEDAVCKAPHRMHWRRLVDAAAPLQRIEAATLVIDRHGMVVDAYGCSAQVGDRVLPETGEFTCGKTFVPALGWSLLEPLPEQGWLIRAQQGDEDTPVIQVTLDLTDPIQGWVKVSGPNVSWQSTIRPLHAKILQQLASRPEGLTPQELNAQLYRPAAKTTVIPEMSKLRKELGGLLQPRGNNNYKLDPNITLDIKQLTNASISGL
jgi:hypothetical protein